jgi:acetyl esterase/lipase
LADADIDAIRVLLAASPRAADLKERRARLDGFGARYSVAPDIKVEPVDAGGVEAEWTLAPSSDPSRVLLFLHGGGYISGSIASHRHLVAQAGREARCRTLALGYRLAPEHPFPAALDDTLAAYRFLLAQGIKPKHIALGGESAGGGLALAAMVSLRDAGAPLPACAWLSSPWTDLEQNGASMQTRASVDPLIQKPYLDELSAQYRAGADTKNPLISPLHADLRGLPPLLIQVGSAETLLDDSIRLADVAGQADLRVTLDIWPDMIHAFTLFYQQVAAARRALREVGAFVRAATGAEAT